MIHIHVLGITNLLCFSEILEQLVAKSVSTVDHSLIIFLFFKVEHTPTYKCLNNIETDLHKKTPITLRFFFFFINNPC